MKRKNLTKEDIRKIATDITKKYLDEGWIFNFDYMRCSNGYEFAAVTDGNDTITVAIDFKDGFGPLAPTRIIVEKFEGSNDRNYRIWIDNGDGEMIKDIKFLYDYESDTFREVDNFNIKEISKKKTERMISKKSERKEVSGKMYPAIVNLIKKQGFNGLKRIKASDISKVTFDFNTNRYIVKIKGRVVYIHRDGFTVEVF